MEKIVIDVYANLYYLVIAFSYMFSYMLYDFMQDGMIFSKYGAWIRSGDVFWKKPLGNCLKCFHIWIAIIIQIIFISKFNLLLFILTISYSYHKLVKNYYN